VETLNAGGRLNVGQELMSKNGLYRLVMQGDGNLVLYQGVTSLQSAVWATNTWGLQSLYRPVRADMQSDGNFVLYSAYNIPAWASGTHMYPGSRITLQDDRNLVIYDQNNTPRWASNTVDPYYKPPTTLPIRRSTGLVNVAWGKSMSTDATLYRDGRLIATTYTKNDNWWAGLRGRILIVAVDTAGRAIWVSPDFQCTTRCAVPDMSCASYGTDLFSDSFPEAFGRYASYMDIYQAEIPSFSDLRQRTIDGIKALKDIVDVAADLKKAITDLFG